MPSHTKKLMKPTSFVIPAVLFSNYAYRLQDLAGYGVALAVGKELGAAFSDRSFRSPLVELLVKSGRNGICKTWLFLLIFLGVASGFILTFVFQVKTMEKATTCMKREASQNQIHQCFQ